jgi:predicted nucleic acid-binding protein
MRSALNEFLERGAPVTRLHAVVVQELRAGAHTPRQARALESTVFGPFERRGRVFGPSPEAFKECGRVLATLWRKDGVPFRDRPRSLVNDILIATSCRERGVVLITADRDFRLLAPHMRGFDHRPPWPS